MPALPSEENDLRAIEAINQRDVQGALANDAEMMMSQWTDDFVLLQPAEPLLRGRHRGGISWRDGLCRDTRGGHNSRS